MKIGIEDSGIAVEFSSGGKGKVLFDEIVSISLETIPTMTVDVDIVSLSYENGEYIEISDESEGFHAALSALSERFKIEPSLENRFPVEQGTQLSVYKNTKSN